MSDKNKKDWKKFKEDQVMQGADVDEDLDETEEVSAVRDASALDHPSYALLEEKLTFAEQQAHENWEKSVRAIAELDNVRRRAERDVTNAHRFGLEKILNSLLPVVDSLEQALQLADKSGDTSMQEGLTLTIKLFVDVLEKYGVKQLDPQGATFDPQQHEAMSIQPSDDFPPNTILTVFQRGYVLNDRVIRPARVIVSK